MLHMNPDTKKVGRCKAEKGGCPFIDASDPNGGHYETQVEMDAYRERKAELEAQNLETGLGSTPKKPALSKPLTLTGEDNEISSQKVTSVLSGIEGIDTDTVKIDTAVSSTEKEEILISGFGIDREGEITKAFEDQGYVVIGRNPGGTAPVLSLIKKDWDNSERKGLVVYRNDHDKEVLEKALFDKSQDYYGKLLSIKPVELKGFNYYQITGGPGSKAIREQLEAQGYTAVDTHSGNVLLSEKSLNEPEDVRAIKSMNWLNKNLTESADNPLEATHYIDKVFGIGATRAFYKKANVTEVFREATSASNQEAKKHFSELARDLSDQGESLELDFSNSKTPLSGKSLEDIDKFGEDLLQSKRSEIAEKALDPDWNKLESLKGKPEYETMKQNLSRALAGLAGYKKDSDLAQKFYSNYAKETGLVGIKPDREAYPMTNGYPVPSNEMQEGLKGLASYYKTVNTPDNRNSTESFIHATPLGEALKIDAKPFGRTVIRSLDISKKSEPVEPVITPMEWKVGNSDNNVREVIWQREYDGRERRLHYNIKDKTAVIRDHFPSMPGGPRAFRTSREPEQNFILQDRLPKDYTGEDIKNYLVSESIRQNFDK